MIRTTPAILSSVWGDMVRSISCRFNPDTGGISDVQTTEFHSPDDIPQSQFVTVDGHQYAVERNENGDLAAVLTYGVFVSRNGYCRVKATSPAEARRIVDDTFSDDQVSWDENWNTTDAQVEEADLL